MIGGRALGGLAMALALGACGNDRAAQAARGEPVACALDRAETFAEDCRLERALVDGKHVLVVHHPDGAFRRFEVAPDGQNLLAADGAEESQSARKGDRFEVILGADRYVIPVQRDAGKP